MLTPAQVRGMLLEEAILRLLRSSGYKTVEEKGNDPTLDKVAAGLRVKGRGEPHQIDAIADFLIPQPFSNPQRLLVEAKCYKPSKRVGLPEVRNTVGVLKDVSEFWSAGGRSKIASKQRYHYQFALFSASGFTGPAQRYAFAQDIYLLPVAKVQFLKPIIDAIRSASVEVLCGVKPRGFAALRGHVREVLQDHRGGLLRREGGFDPDGALNEFFDACQRLDYALIAVVARTFPLFLVPAPDVSLADLTRPVRVKIFWDEAGWYLVDQHDRPLFSFDMPQRLFEMYARHGMLTPERALDLKADYFGELQAFHVYEGQVRLLTLRLDRDWLGQIRDRTRGRPQR